MHQLQKQAKEVVSPLIEQIKERENELTILRKTNAKQLKNLKMLHCVMRSPILTDQYQKQVRQNVTEKQMMILQKEAFDSLQKQHNLNERNQKKLIKDLSVSVDESLQEETKIQPQSHIKMARSPKAIPIFQSECDSPSKKSFKPARDATFAEFIDNQTNQSRTRNTKSTLTSGAKSNTLGRSIQVRKLQTLNQEHWLTLMTRSSEAVDDHQTVQSALSDHNSPKRITISVSKKPQK